MIRALTICIGLCLVVASFGRQAAGQEWTRFRGPNGSGVSPVTTVPIVWTEADYNWKQPLPGWGHSSPVVWGEKLFLTSGDEPSGRRVAVCLHTSDGRVLWTEDYATARHEKHELNSFASATPVVDDQHVYISWSTAEELAVLALDHDGNQSWRRVLGPYESLHGHAASPVLCNGLVVVADDQDIQSSLIALDCRTGEVRWQVPRQSTATYSTPCVFRAPGGPAELIFTNREHGITSIDATTGATIWELDVFQSDVSVASPITAGGLIIGSCGGVGVKNEVVAVHATGEGDGRKPREVYRLDKRTPLVPTPLAFEHLLFTWSDEGLVTCADLQSGTIHWRERVGGKFCGSPVYIGGRLYAVSTDGEAVVVSASRRFELLARNALGEGSHSTPAISGGTMYLRTFSHLISIGGPSATAATNE